MTAEPCNGQSDPTHPGATSPAATSATGAVATAPKGWRSAGPVAIIATALSVLGSLAVPAIGFAIAPWLRSQGPTGAVLFVSAFALLGAVAASPTYSTAIIGGWTFGFRIGLLAVMTGVMIGAAICFLAYRRVATHRVKALFDEHPRWEIVRKALAEERWYKTLWIVFLLRLSPVLPFGTTNVMMATTGVSLPIYLIGTLLGLTPRLSVVALAASRAEKLDFDLASSWVMLGAGIIATGVCVLALALIGKHALERATR